MSPPQPSGSLSQVATEILRVCNAIQQGSPIDQANDKSTASEESSTINAQRTALIGLLSKLTLLVQGPHEYLHEFVASNWDHSALYTCLQAGILQHIASAQGLATLSHLSQASGIPSDKLYRILGLLRCKDIIAEPEHELYALTPVAEELLSDSCFRDWVEFQSEFPPCFHFPAVLIVNRLFETRVASAYLSDALASQPNTYENGKSAFLEGFGSEMYDWHAAHPDKGQRFRQAMKGVSASLDPADTLLRQWFGKSNDSPKTKVVELGGRYGFGSIALSQHFPELSFEVRSDNQVFLDQGAQLVDAEARERVSFECLPNLQSFATENDANTVRAYILRNVLWNWNDKDAAVLLKHILTASKNPSSVRLLITDGVSPLGGEFEAHVEAAYRRRDVTMMAMHNVKQRTQEEWLALFAQAHPQVKVNTTRANSSHVCKGLWEITVEVAK